jgi:hypothetical protein
MDIVNEIENHISLVYQGILNDDLNRGSELLERFEEILSKFNGFNDPSFDLDENQLLLSDLLAYESEVCHLECMEFFYGHISRMFLQVGEPNMCIMYALACRELNDKSGERKGVNASKMVICDCAIEHDASSIAAELLKEVHPHLKEDIFYLSRLPNHNAGVINKLLKQKKRPPSYRHLKSEEAKLKERKIRFFMMAQGMSRATAMNTVKRYPSK